MNCSFLDDDVRFHSVVAGGEQRYARLPPLAEAGGDRRERLAGRQHRAAHQVGGDVAIA
jgi:hypothetical protein